MNACRVCDHADRGEIDRLLSEGMSQRRVAARYAPLHRDSIRRHVTNKHAQLMPAGGPDELGDDASAAAIMRSALNRLRVADISRMSPNVLVQHSQAIRQLGESLAKVEYDPTKVIALGVNDVKGLKEFIHVLAATLEEAECEKCGHYNGPALREQIALAIDVAGIEMEAT